MDRDRQQRQALGGVSPNVMANRRMSIAPSRVAKGAPAAKGRQSMAPAAAGAGRAKGSNARVSRASTIGDSKSDPRPLKNAQWQNSTVHRIIVYGAENGYDQPLSPAILDYRKVRKPQFEHLLQFLMRKADPRWRPAEDKKMEEEVLQVLKFIKYQHLPSKSALFTPGTDTTWPQMLGLLRYWVDYLQYNRKVEAAPPEHAWENSELAKFYEFVGESYGLYLQARDDEDTKLTERTKEKCQEEGTRLEQACSALEQEKGALQRRLQELQSGPSELEVQQAKVEEVNCHRDKLRGYIASTKREAEKQARKAQIVAAEVVKLQREKRQMLEDMAELRQRVAEQPYTKEQAEAMNADKTKQTAELQKLQKQHAALVQACNAAQAELDGIHQKLDEAAEGHNSAAGQLGLIAPGGGGIGKRAEGVVYEVHVNLEATTQADVLTADLKGEVARGLAQLRSRYQRAAADLREKHFEEEDRDLSLVDTIRERVEESACLRSEVTMLRRNHDEAVALAEQRIRALQEEAALIAAQAAELRGAGTMDANATKQDLLLKLQQLERLEGELQHEKLQLQQQVRQAAQALKDHQEEVAKVLLRGKRELASVQTELQGDISSFFSHTLRAQLPQQNFKYVCDVALAAGYPRSRIPAAV